MKWIRKHWFFVLAAVVVSYMLCEAVLQISGLRMNWTSSVPIGLYRKAPYGQYAALCLPAVQLESGIKSGLEIPAGDCPATGLVPILKPMYTATPESPISFTRDGFYVDGRLLPNTAPKAVSRAGKRLAHVAYGTYSSGLWAISDFNRDSFDSRYFGKVDPSSIYFHAKPLLTTSFKGE